MYLKRIEIRNIKCFSDLIIDFSEGRTVRSWTTIFGKNGLGKSTLLQTIGAVLAGPSAIKELLPVAEGWVRKGENYGEIIADVFWTEGDALTAIAQSGAPKKKSPYQIRYIVTGENPDLLPESWKDRYAYTVPSIASWSGLGKSKERENITKDLKRLQQTAFSESKKGWLACGYGPFRRLSGGGQAADRLVYSGRISARFVTLFREDAALSNTTEWLIGLHNTAREGNVTSEKALEQIKNIFQKDFFPEPTELMLDASSVKLKVGGKEPVSLGDLSDGYRSMLALSIDLLKWLVAAFPDAPNPLKCSGVVVIDELDAHLHPDWQRQIGHWLLEKFPKLQFIIATHSPFLAQVANSEEGNGDTALPAILNRTGKNIILEQTENGVITNVTVGAVQNLRADQILQTELFDVESLYSPKTQKKIQEFESLYRKKKQKKLSRDEQKKYEQLSFWREEQTLLSTPEERDVEQKLRDAINRHSEELEEIS